MHVQTVDKFVRDFLPSWNRIALRKGRQTSGYPLGDRQTLFPEIVVGDSYWDTAVYARHYLALDPTEKAFGNAFHVLVVSAARYYELHIFDSRAVCPLKGKVDNNAGNQAVAVRKKPVNLCLQRAALAAGIFFWASGSLPLPFFARFLAGFNSIRSFSTSACASVGERQSLSC